MALLGMGWRMLGGLQAVNAEDGVSLMGGGIRAGLWRWHKHMPVGSCRCAVLPRKVRLELGVRGHQRCKEVMGLPQVICIYTDGLIAR